MAQGLYTPLQLTAIAGLMSNQGLLSLPAALTDSIYSYENTAVVTDFLNAVNYYVAQSWATESTLQLLLNIGSSTCPALGDSVPSSYTNLTQTSTPYGFSGLVLQTGNAYLGNGDCSKFCQGFAAVQSYINITNQLINSSVNAQTYLGPTFRNMDFLVTNGISDINSDLTGFGVDLANQGQLTNLANIDMYGTPAALLQQISTVARLQGGTLQGVETPLLAAGLTKSNIKTLINRGPLVPDYEFDQYQRLAYTGMTNVTGTDLQTVLDILDVTTPNIQTMADLLNQQKIFPNSWRTLNTTTPAGPVPVYLSDGSVNSSLAPTIDTYLPTATGCEDLGKIIPPNQAIANKAVQVALQQITGLVNSTLPKLSQAVLGTTSNTWDVNKVYLPNAVVNNDETIPTFYRAQQTVPAGTDINNTEYWSPTTLGGINTMAGLPNIQDQTQPLAPDVVAYYSTSLATGSGSNGTITTCDVLGLAINYNHISNQFDVATETIDALNSMGALNTLKSIYVSMLSAANDAAMQTLISNANTEITNIVVALPDYAFDLNTAFSTIAEMLSSEKNYQTAAGINYFELTAGLQPGVMSFVQNLPRYGQQTEAAGPAQFLNEVADTTNLYGQAIIGCMREGQNTVRLDAAQLRLDTTPETTPPVTPTPAVNPVTVAPPPPDTPPLLMMPALFSIEPPVDPVPVEPPVDPVPVEPPPVVEPEYIVTEDFFVTSEPGIEIFIRNKHLSSQTQFSSNKTVIYVHGSQFGAQNVFDLPLDGQSWMDYIAMHGYDVYFFEIRGYGGSTRPAEMTQPANLRAVIGNIKQGTVDLHAAVSFIKERRNINKVILLGHSLGSSISQRYTNLYPDNVERLVLYGAARRDPYHSVNTWSVPTYRDMTRSETENYLLIGVSEEQKVEIWSEEYFDIFWQATIALDPIGSALDPQVVRIPNGWLKDVYMNWTDGTSNLWDTTTIAVPVLITTGEWDTKTPPAAQRMVLSELINAPYKTFVELAKGTHKIAIEKNRMHLFTVVQEFLDTNF